MSSNEYARQENQVVSNVDEFIIEAPEEDPNFDKLNSLVTVLENDIRKAHNNSIAIEKVIMSIRSAAYESAHSPQAEHVTLLYCHMAEETKAQQREITSKKTSFPNYSEQEEDNNSDTVSLIGDIPFFLYSGSSHQIVGWQALSKNVFYSRAATALFSFIAFVIMSCVPYIGWRYVDPDRYLQPDCLLKGWYKGEFSFISFQYVLALCVLIFLHSALWLGYYLLPVDTAERKYVPGMRKLFDSCLNPSDVTSYGQRVGGFFRLYSKSLEPILDGVFLAVLGVATLLGSLNLGHAVAFYNTYEEDNQLADVYFSIITYMRTFESAENSDNCLVDNPIGLIRASLVMSFLAACCLAFTFQVTLRSFLMERKRQKLGEGAGGLASQQLPADSEDGGNVRQPYESSSASEEDGGYRLPSDEEGGAGMKQFVRV